MNFRNIAEELTQWVHSLFLQQKGSVGAAIAACNQAENGICALLVEVRYKRQLC